VLLPIELYRQLESAATPRIASPRLVNPADAERFRMEVTVMDPEPNTSDAGL